MNVHTVQYNEVGCKNTVNTVFFLLLFLNIHLQVSLSTDLVISDHTNPLSSFIDSFSICTIYLVHKLH